MLYERPASQPMSYIRVIPAVSTGSPSSSQPCGSSADSASASESAETEIDAVRSAPALYEASDGTFRGPALGPNETGMRYIGLSADAMESTT